MGMTDMSYFLSIILFEGMFALGIVIMLIIIM